MPRLAFDLSTMVSHIGGPSICQNTVFSETTPQIELKHLKTP